MARLVKTKTRKIKTSYTYKPSSVENKIGMPKLAEQTLFQKLTAELDLSKSYSSLVLGLLIILVMGILVFNYFKKNQTNLVPAQQTTSETQTVPDVSVGNLPGQYTVKNGDTLYTIADKYYKDGFKFTKIVEANKLVDANNIAVGQVLDIPVLGSETANNTASTDVTKLNADTGTGGAVNQTVWGEKISGDTYTVQEGDWLSKIAGRAYGDIFAFDKIAKANNISNPDVIEPGMVLKIPR